MKKLVLFSLSLNLKNMFLLWRNHNFFLHFLFRQLCEPQDFNGFTCINSYVDEEYDDSKYTVHLYIEVSWDLSERLRVLNWSNVYFCFCEKNMNNDRCILFVFTGIRVHVFYSQIYNTTAGTVGFYWYVRHHNYLFYW